MQIPDIHLTDAALLTVFTVYGTIKGYPWLKGFLNGKPYSNGQLTKQQLVEALSPLVNISRETHDKLSEFLIRMDEREKAELREDLRRRRSD